MTTKNQKMAFDGSNLLRCAHSSTFNLLTGDTINQCSSQGGVLMASNENEFTPWDSAISEMNPPDGIYSDPVPDLSLSHGLANSCVDLVLDIGPCGLT